MLFEKQKLLLTRRRLELGESNEKNSKKNVAKQLILGQSLLSEAKLGTSVEINIQNGAIIILPGAKKKGWQALAKLGEDAIEGVLDEPAQNHDSYLYGKDR